MVRLSSALLAKILLAKKKHNLILVYNKKIVLMTLSTGGRQEAREAPGSGQTLRNHHPGIDVLKLFFFAFEPK
jgi:hypothetical protein